MQRLGIMIGTFRKKLQCMSERYKYVDAIHTQPNVWNISTVQFNVHFFRKKDLFCKIFFFFARKQRIKF